MSEVPLHSRSGARAGSTGNLEACLMPESEEK